MKIKIGNFNFISNKENKYSGLSGYDSLNEYMKYFYLDGKEDTLYVTSIFNFEAKHHPEFYQYERDLADKYKVMDVYRKAREQIQEYIKNKVQDIFDNRAYSKYELYKNLDTRSINTLNAESKFSFDFYDKLVIDFDSNRINIGKFQFNPYTENVQNLDELYKQGVLDKTIRNSIIIKEMEKGIAPPYTYEINKIMDFVKDKETINLIFDNAEKFKCRAGIGHFLRYYDGVIEISLGYQEGKSFEKANPGKREEELKINNLIGLSYGRNILEIDNMALANIDMQIAISPEDRLKLRTDILKNDIEKNIVKHLSKLYEKGYKPHSLEEAINEIKNLDDENKKIKDGILEGPEKEYPLWYSKELKELFYKYDLVNYLKTSQTLEEIKEICVELEDNELKEIYYSLLCEEGSLEENKEEEIGCDY